MARTSRRTNSIEPAQRALFYAVTPSSGAFDVIIDVAKDLSSVNRRLYRQGMQYYIHNVKIATGKGKIFSIIQTAGDTWMVHNAWKKGFAFWRAQQKLVDDKLGTSAQGKWADFKVELWDGGASAISQIAGGDAVTPDEWNLSNYVWDDDGTERTPTFCLIGSTSVTSKIGLVQEYHISRTQVQQGPVVEADMSGSIYAKSLVNDEAIVDLIDIVEAENDTPPYDQNEMVGGDTLADEPVVQSMSFASELQASNSGGFTAECGLLRISGTSQLTATFPHSTSNDNNYDDIHYLEENLDEACVIQVIVAPGPYKGVMASPMGQ